ncbi:MAG: DUF4236 domain-containing protein [Pseudohongiella sp.]|nr:DUF4236 domain-containing protein [Pseudohongiella sp.]
MAWYLRKSVSVGPIRLNLSKGGVGASVGVTGFRVGMRPDGSSYVHAGRHGLYMREELGRRKDGDQAAPLDSVGLLPTQKFDAVSARDLIGPERKELIDRLNKAYKDLRLDYLVFIVAMSAFGVAWLNDSQLGMLISGSLGVLLGIAASVFESRRRTVKIIYEFEADDMTSFSKLVQAVNHLAECKRIWAYIDSRDLTSAHESKVNAGASSLIKREPAVIGTGTPPWVETNITIPTLKARGITAYFMPDCILVYDSAGVGCVEHSSLSFSTSAERFIEDGQVPSDSNVVDRTWKYANKRGGPDRRFKDNREIPICLYGKLDLSTSAGLLCHLQTSKSDAPQSFSKQYLAYLKTIDVGRGTGA